MRRARETAGLTTRQVADALAPHVTQSTLVRIERMLVEPSDRKSRARTVLLLLLYGFELADFGVSEADLPPAIDLRALERLRRLSTKWYLTGAVRPLLRVAA